MSERFASVLHLHAQSKRALANRISPHPHLLPITASASSNVALMIPAAQVQTHPTSSS